MSNQEEKRKLLKNLGRYSGLGIQIGVTIYLGSLLGEWLDTKYPNEDELYFKICTLLAVFLAMFSLIRQVIRNT